MKIEFEVSNNIFYVFVGSLVRKLRNALRQVYQKKKKEQSKTCRI